MNRWLSCRPATKIEKQAMRQKCIAWFGLMIRRAGCLKFHEISAIAALEESRIFRRRGGFSIVRKMTKGNCSVSVVPRGAWHASPSWLFEDHTDTSGFVITPGRGRGSWNIYAHRICSRDLHIRFWIQRVANHVLIAPARRKSPRNAALTAKKKKKQNYQ